MFVLFMIIVTIYIAWADIIIEVDSAGNQVYSSEVGTGEIGFFVGTPTVQAQIVPSTGPGAGASDIKPSALDISQLNISEIIEALQPYLTEGELYNIRLYVPSLWIKDSPNYVFADLIFKNNTIRPNIEKVLFYLTTDCNTDYAIETRIGQLFEENSYITQLTIPSNYNSNTYCVTVRAFHGGFIERADVKIDFGKKTVAKSLIDKIKEFLFGKTIEKISIKEQLMRFREWKFWDFIYSLFFGI